MHHPNTNDYKHCTENVHNGLCYTASVALFNVKQYTTMYNIIKRQTEVSSTVSADVDPASSSCASAAGSYDNKTTLETRVDKSSPISPVTSAKQRARKQYRTDLSN